MNRSLPTLALLAALTLPTAAFAQSADVAQDDDGVTSMPGFNPATHVPTPGPSHAGGPIYDNGGLATGTTTSSGVTVPTPGYQWSEVQNDAGNMTESNTSAGATCTTSGTTAFRLADDFIIPDGETWTIESITGYAYQTGAAGATPVNAATLRILDGPPGDPGSTVVFGDGTTNRLASSTEAQLYRVFNTSVPPPGSAPGTTRRVWANTITVSPALALGPGTYWIDYAFGVTSGTLFCPSVTIPGTRGLPGWNAMQFTGTNWVAYLDTGNPVAAPDVPQDFPFQIAGTITGGGGATTYPSTMPETNIPDGSGSNVPGTPLVDVITVPAGAGMVEDVDVYVDATHSWMGDLIMTLEHGATTVTFYDRPGSPATTFGCSANNIDAYADDEGTDGAFETACVGLGTGVEAFLEDGRYTPNNPLSAFDGAPATGTWTLTVTDNGGGDTGALTTWAVVITGGTTAGDGGPASADARLRVSPNPIVSTGQVELTVGTAQDVRVAVYDLLGREVRVLFEGSISAAQQAFMSFRTDDLAPGTYIVRATGEALSLTQRVTVVR